MKILLAHNYYGSSAPSGENAVYEAERYLLKNHNHDVIEFSRHSDEIRNQGMWGTYKGALSTPWNPFTAASIKNILRREQPAVLHAHNTFPLISPAIFYSARESATPTVLTLHNYRLFCPAGIPMRNGEVCTECLDNHSSLPALKYGCYRDSRLATSSLALNVALHRKLGTWVNHVDAFITLTEFQRERMIEAGLPADLVNVKPNFYPGEPTTVPWARRRPSVVFAGRLSMEKGVKALLQAWLLWGVDTPQLRIVGDGEMRVELEQLAATAPDVPISFLGQLTSDAAQEEIANASLLVLPSECFEGFPMVVREAFAFGTPVAVSNIGPLPSIVQHGENGVVFAPGDPQSLYKVVRKVWESAGEMEQLGTGARSSFDELYTEDENYKNLMAIYQQAIEVRRERNGR